MVAAITAALIATALGSGGGGAAKSAPSEVPADLFARTSFWNTPLQPGAPLAPNSALLSASLVRQLRSYRPWIATTAYSTPVYSVPAGQATVRVQLDHPPSPNAAALQRELDRVPMPAGARPAAGTDARMVIWQPATDTMWELWHVSYVSLGFGTGWHAGWGGVMHHVSRSTGVYRWPFGATASGLPLIGGLITLDDMRSGRIDHELALGVPRVQLEAFVPPANRTDGHYSGFPAIPMGTRFRLDPKLDVNSLGLPPVARMIALAAQRYGLIVRDGSGAVTFYAQDPTPTGSNPYPAWFGYQSPSKLLRNFPWSRLQVVSPRTSSP
jgi:hypothetical protein